ncbi:hypothetical protein ACQ4M3_19980 [Leptolyngbya sp. AN03gr2]|uniref:hypothetical protein n=1 Tax=unclassified Leptolyngbya TaxID=2650499 RepID=UPI003D31A7E1
MLVTRSKLITDRRTDLKAFLKAADQGSKPLKAGDKSAIATELAPGRFKGLWDG